MPWSWTRWWPWRPWWPGGQHGTHGKVDQSGYQELHHYTDLHRLHAFQDLRCIWLLAIRSRLIQHLRQSSVVFDVFTANAGCTVCTAIVCRVSLPWTFKVCTLGEGRLQRLEQHGGDRPGDYHDAISSHRSFQHSFNSMRAEDAINQRVQYLSWNHLLEK